MNYIRTEIPEVIIVEPTVFEDKRGYFFESFRADSFSQFVGKEIRFVQDNESRSSYGVVRGLHYQKPPFVQAKLVRCLQGKVLDVAVDMREKSPTFGQFVAVELSAENKRQLYIPHGFAHGFSTLSDTAVFAYKCDNYYSKEHERSVRLNDPTLSIDWQIPNDKKLVSDKDLQTPLLQDAWKF